MLNGKVPITVYQPDRADEIWLLSFALDITKRKQMEEDLKEETSIKCFHYVVDSANNQNLITDLSVPVKIVDHKEIRFNQLS